MTRGIYFVACNGPGSRRFDPKPERIWVTHFSNWILSQTTRAKKQVRLVEEIYRELEIDANLC